MIFLLGYFAGFLVMLSMFFIWTILPAFRAYEASISHKRSEARFLLGEVLESLLLSSIWPLSAPAIAIYLTVWKVVKDAFF